MSCSNCQPQFTKCPNCNDGTINANIEFTINVPGGIQNGNTLRLSNAGHFAGQIFGQDKYTDILINMIVEPNDLFSIQNNDIIYTLNITLLEALTRMYKNSTNFRWYQ